MSPPDPSTASEAPPPRPAGATTDAPAPVEEGLGREIQALVTVYVALGILAALYGAAFAPGQ